MNDIHEDSIGTLCRRIKSGELSAASVAEQTFTRIHALDGTYKAYARLLEDRALAKAEALDEAQAAGEPLGLLHGVPLAVKDLLFMEGTISASGTLVMRNYDPGYTATVVRKLEDAGAVIVGKTQLTEGAFGAHHPDIDPPKNPWHLDHWPGVSSSGSGAAVSARLAHGALGSDTGGSIRFPSASCGLVGLKPTYGRVSRYGAFPLAESLDHIGPMTRSVEDAARMLHVIAGRDPLDATTAELDVPNYVSALEDGYTGTIGIDRNYVSTGVDAAVVEVVEEALQRFASLGFTVKEVELPADYRTLVEQWGVTCSRECAKAHTPFFPAERAQYGPVLERLLDLGLSVSPELYAEIEKVRRRFTAEFEALFSEIDLFICPAMVSPPPTVAHMDARQQDPDDVAPFITFTAPFDYSGHPTITLPAGTRDGLPTSFQLVGAQFDEATLFKAGFRYEGAVGVQGLPNTLRDA